MLNQLRARPPQPPCQRRIESGIYHYVIALSPDGDHLRFPVQLRE